MSTGIKYLTLLYNYLMALMKNDKSEKLIKDHARKSMEQELIRVLHRLELKHPMACGVILGEMLASVEKLKDAKIITSDTFHYITLLILQFTDKNYKEFNKTAKEAEKKLNFKLKD